MRKFLSVLLVALACDTAQAGGGSWGGTAYRVYPQPAYATATATVTLPAVTEVGWRSKFLDVKYGIAKLDAESRDYQAAIGSLDGTPVQGAYGAPVAAQGNTVSAEYYRGFGQGNYLMGSNVGANPHVLANAWVRGVDKLGDVHGQVHQALAYGAQQEQSANLEVAKINATRDLAVAIMKASTPDEVKKVVSQAVVNQQIQVPPDPFAGPPNQGPVIQGGQQRAVYGVAPGDLSRLPLKAIWKRVLDPDPAKRMPLKESADGFDPGDHLPLEEMQILLRADNPTAFRAVLSARCTVCHNAQRKLGELDLTQP